jgi:hypothetical protein
MMVRATRFAACPSPVGLLPKALHDHPRDPADAQLSGELMDQASERRDRAGSDDHLARGEQRGTQDRAEHDVPDRRGDRDPTSGAGQAPAKLSIVTR